MRRFIDSALGSGHESAFELNRNGSTHDFEQHADAAGIVEAVQDSELLGKGAGGEANPSANLQAFLEAKEAVRIDRSDHRFHDAVRHRAGHLALHDEAGDAERSVDAAPALAGEIEADEEVARKERGGEIAQLAGVAHGLEPLRQKDLVGLIFQLVLRPQLAVWLGMDGIPALVLVAGNGMQSSTFAGFDVFGNTDHPPPERLCPPNGALILRPILQVKACEAGTLAELWAM